MQVDLADRDQALALIPRAVEALDGLDILVNNAGTQARHPAEEFPLEDWDRVLTINLDAVWILAQAAGRHMLEQGGGKIINIASEQSFFGGVTVPAYAASKGGVAQLTKALANEWAGRSVNVNAIAPGYMATEMVAALVGNPQREPAILARIPAGRWGTPADLGGAVIFSGVRCLRLPARGHHPRGWRLSGALVDRRQAERDITGGNRWDTRDSERTIRPGGPGRRRHRRRWGPVRGHEPGSGAGRGQGRHPGPVSRSGPAGRGRHQGRGRRGAGRALQRPGQGQHRGRRPGRSWTPLGGWTS